VVVALVVAAEDDLDHWEGDIVELVIESIESRTSIAHFPPGFMKVVA